jgi:hypothetical protein
MIVAYTGLAGSGKTYHMTRIALALIQRSEIVFSRHELEGAYPLIDEREMLKMRDCHVFFDEWHQDHSAKEWWNMDEVLKHIVTQSRKYGITIHWSAQHWLYMDSFIRRNTDWCWIHRALFRDADTGVSKIGLHRAYKVAGLEAELKHRNPEVLAKRWIVIRRKVYERYDSFKPIMLSKAKLSDADVAAIGDPYSRAPIHLTTEHLKNHQPYLVTDESGLDRKDEADYDDERIKREHEADELRAGVEVTDP